ncbi:hypothetical protein GOP47_0029881 [Adiantum capillus-veneris]|nr:hypothetical protein GOP47_0029881 [Adiantum capillus-veneris]
MGFLFFRKKKDEDEEHEIGSLEKIVGPPHEKTWQERWEQYKLEAELRPDYTKFPGVEEERKRSPFFTNKPPSTPEAAARERRVREELPKAEIFQLLRRAQHRREKKNAEAIARNSRPYRPEDTKLWQSLPHVPHPVSGLPMPRMAIKSFEQAQATFWDFFKQFHFGLWGYRQRPYPIEKPNDIQQMLGYKWLDKRYADFTMRSGGWYYKDRLGRTRGPMELVNMKTAWAAGVIDRNTFIWGDDMDEWAPISMVYGVEQCVDGPDMSLALAGLDFIHRITRGLPIFGPKKGHERKSYKQLQSEALEKKEKEKAVLRLNGGIWPGERTPSHCLFLWAGGSELTRILEDDNKIMPDKFIPYEVRKELAEIIPGLRPWEVFEIEQIMESVTYGEKWYREPLSEFTMRADYDEAWFNDYKDKWEGLS